MNAFVEAIKNDPKPVLTENGSWTYSTSLNSCVDLFFQIAAMRGQNTERLFALFEAAISENREIAARIMLWARDVRGGAGERQIFRILLAYCEKNYPDLVRAILAKVPELGRWDDLLVLLNARTDIRDNVFAMINDALNNGDGLCAKWMPRQGSIARTLATKLGMTPRQWRKKLVALTKVVETQMCAKQWDQIEYGKVPSLASIRYANAFKRHDEKRYLEYLEKVSEGKDKINAGAVYPYDVLKGIRADVTKETIVEQWKALPNYAGDASILPMIDVSGSMFVPIGRSGIQAVDVAVSLGLYFSEKNRGPFKDVTLTFSGEPDLKHLKGDIMSRYQQMVGADWGMNTNLDAAFEKILKVAIKNKVPQADMPEHVLVISDMEFDAAAYSDETTFERILNQYKDAGYKAPRIVWWNIQSRQNNVPVKATQKNTALVSGFSPSIAKAVLSGNLESFTPEMIMLEAVMSKRYNF